MKSNFTMHVGGWVTDNKEFIIASLMFIPELQFNYISLNNSIVSYSYDAT